MRRKAAKNPKRDGEDVMMTSDPWTLPTLLRTRNSEASPSASPGSGVKHPPLFNPQPSRGREEDTRSFGSEVREPIMVLGGWDEPTMRSDILAEIDV